MQSKINNLHCPDCPLGIHKPGRNCSVCPLFRNMSVDEHDAFLRKYENTIIEFDKNEMVVRQGDPINSIYLLMNGTVRTQMITIEISMDGENFSPLLAEQNLSFDPMTGNAVLLSLDPTRASFVRFTFLENSGAGGGQVSEIMFFD